MTQWIPLPRSKRVSAGVAALAFAAISLGAVAAEPEGSWARYRVLVKRNIFLRDRARAASSRPASTRPVKGDMQDGERNVVLTGVARRDGEFVAFFEDIRTRTTSKVGVGQAIGKGKARAITLDGVEYERQGLVRKIEIGRSLTGSIAVLRGEWTPSSAPAQPAGPARTRGRATTGPAQPTTRPGASPSGAAKTSTAKILERMRRRRQQELRK